MATDTIPVFDPTKPFEEAKVPVFDPNKPLDTDPKPDHGWHDPKTAIKNVFHLLDALGHIGQPQAAADEVSRMREAPSQTLPGMPPSQGLPPGPMVTTPNQSEPALGAEILDMATSPVSYLGIAGEAGKGIKAVGEGLKSTGSKVLKIAAKPTIPSMTRWNPPNFEVPLREGLVPKFKNGGMEGVGQNITEKVGEVAGKRDEILANAKIRLVGSGALNDAKKDIISGIGKQGGLSAPQAREIPKYIDEAFETAQSYPSFKGGKGGWSLDGSDAVEFRKWMDEQANFSRINKENVREKFYGSLRRKFEDQIDTRMGQTNVAKRIGVEGKDEYAKAKKLLSELVPVQKAFDRRVVQEGNNQMIGLGETGLVAGAIARGDAAAIAKAGIAVGIKRLLSRPGGAAILYQTGQKLESPVLQKLFSVAAKTGQISMLSARLVDAIETAEGKKKDLLEKKLNEQLDKEQNMEPMGFVATTQQGREQ